MAGATALTDGNTEVRKMTLLTECPPDLTQKENKEKRSNPSITNTNKGIVSIYQYSTKVIFCIDFIAGSLYHLCMCIRLKTSNSEMHSGRCFSLKSYT